MDVVSASSVMAWEDGVESQNAVGVAVLDPTESSLVDVGRVGRASVTFGNNAAVYTLNPDEQLCGLNLEYTGDATNGMGPQ